MYFMKNIINHNDEITLPKCMYSIKNPTQFSDEVEEEFDIGISNQVMKFLKIPNEKMIELEQRQDELIKKLDVLYDRIKTISVNCKVNNQQDASTISAKAQLPIPEDIVLVLSPENLPWFLMMILRESSLTANVSWHIHSSVPNEKVPKIKAFVNKLPNTKPSCKINIRLIFKCVSADSELKISSLAVPIVGNVNILRYLSYVYPSIIPYDHNNHYLDYLLDVCHQLERVTEKNKEPLISKLFSDNKKWIYGSEFTIVDISAYNAIKQWKNHPKTVPKSWLEQCDKLLAC